MSFFYVDQELHLGTPGQSRSVESLLGTYTKPAYIYDLDDITLRFERFRRVFSPLQVSVHYAMKANANSHILVALQKLGAGVDTVSGGEIRLAMSAGFKPEQIVFSGVGKSRSDLEFAIKNQIKQINVESVPELVRIGELSEELASDVSIAFRMNPDVDPKTHPYITTGFRENKFGLSAEELPALVTNLRQFRRLRLRGLTIHIGSQLREITAIADAVEKTKIIYAQLISQGFALDRFDVGGGLGIDYETDQTEEEFRRLQSYGEMVSSLTRGLNAEILTEPGRILVARSGVLVCEVQYIKETPYRRFAIVDTGMHHLLRPALYQAKHRVLPLRPRFDNHDAQKFELIDVVGPICESADVIARDLKLPRLKPGDLLAIADAGAYGFTMASTYNQHALPQEFIYSASQKSLEVSQHDRLI